MNLCEKHRRQAMASTEAASEMWNNLMESAHCKMSKGYWDAAVSMYGSAYEVAEIQLRQEYVGEKDLNRYLRTAREFVYSLRKSSYHINFAGLISVIVNRLEALAQKQIISRPFDAMVEQVKDIAYRPVAEVDQWMLGFAEQAGQVQQLH